MRSGSDCLGQQQTSVFFLAAGDIVCARMEVRGSPCGSGGRVAPVCVVNTRG